MKAWPRLRIVCSLSLGIVAGLLMWMQPQPWPTFTLTLPAPAPGAEDAPFTLQAISSETRHVITFGKHHDEKWKTIHVWDRQRGLDKPVIAVPLDQEGYRSHMILFSPDEQTLAVAVWYWPRTRHDLVWFDLRTGAKIKGVELEMDHILFAPNGKLLYVNAGVVRDVQSGEGLRKLEPTIDGIKYYGSTGDLACYRSENQVRFFSYLTAEVRCVFTLGEHDLDLIGLSHNGQVVSIYGDWIGTANANRYFRLTDGSDNSSRVVYFEDDSQLGQFHCLSPDGSTLISYGSTKRHPLLVKWWPVNKSDVSFYVTRWKTDEQLAELRNVKHVCFSPRGNHLAVQRADLAIDVYDFPLRKPWLSIIGVALAAAVGTWGVGWLWGPWRLRRTPAMPASAPPSA